MSTCSNLADGHLTKDLLRCRASRQSICQTHSWRPELGREHSLQLWIDGASTAEIWELLAHLHNHSVACFLLAGQQQIIERIWCAYPQQDSSHPSSFDAGSGSAGQAGRPCAASSPLKGCCSSSGSQRRWQVSANASQLICTWIACSNVCGH